MQCGASPFVKATALYVLVWAPLGSIPAALAQTAPTTGVLQVSASVESGCRVVGQAQVNGVDFGELDFSSHPSLFKQPLTAQARLASDTLQLRCVGVTSAHITVDAGLHASDNQRRLASGAQHVPYELFLDDAGAEPLSIDTPRSVPISANGALAVVDLPVYGRVPPATGGYSPGSYQDRVQVTVSW
jgi:spore coat protein U-like protein